MKIARVFRRNSMPSERPSKFAVLSTKRTWSYQQPVKM